MKLFVTGRHLVVSATTRQTLTRKLRRLERLMQAHAISAQCILAREREAYVCELTLHARGDHMLHGIGRHTRVAGAAGAAPQAVPLPAPKLPHPRESAR